MIGADRHFTMFDGFGRGSWVVVQSELSIDNFTDNLTAAAKGLPIPSILFSPWFPVMVLCHGFLARRVGRQKTLQTCSDGE